MSDDASANAGADAAMYEPRTGRLQKFPRRILVVDGKLQFRIVFHVFLLSALIGVVGAVLASLFFLDLSGPTPSEDPHLRLQVFFLAGAIGASALLIVTITGILISHGVAGPVHRFRQVMRAIAERRRVPRIVLRRHDYLKGMADDLETLVGALQTESDAAAQAARDAAQGIAAAVEALKAAGKADPKALRQLEEVRERLDRMAAAASRAEGQAG